jgi:hypothetical protein
MTMRITLLAALLISTLCCGGATRVAPNANVSGAYEFVVTSNVTGGVTLVEANLAANGNQSGATGANQVQVLTFEQKNWYVNGICPGSTPGQNSVASNTSGNNISLTFNEGGNAFSGQGVLNGTTINANYSINNSSCPDLTGLTGYPPGTDSGGIVGNQVPKLTGTYSGPLSLPDGTDNAALTLSENPDLSLAVSAQLTGPADNGIFTFSGAAVGNIVFVSGSVNGQNLNLFGYYDRTGTYTKMPNSLLVFDYATRTTVGLLLGP